MPHYLSEAACTSCLTACCCDCLDCAEVCGVAGFNCTEEWHHRNVTATLDHNIAKLNILSAFFILTLAACMGVHSCVAETSNMIQQAKHMAAHVLETFFCRMISDLLGYSCQTRT